MYTSGSRRIVILNELTKTETAGSTNRNETKLHEFQEKLLGKFFDETKQGLLEAAEIAKGNITLTEWENMSAPTFYVADNV